MAGSMPPTGPPACACASSGPTCWGACSRHTASSYRRSARRATTSRCSPCGGAGNGGGGSRWTRSARWGWGGGAAGARGRGGQTRGGGCALDSSGPLGRGARRDRIELPWDAAVYRPLVTARLQASVARAQRRREQGITPLRQLGEGRLFESLRDWVPGDDLRHIDWKATARRGKVITRQYEAERRQQVLLVLDTGRLLTAEIAGLSRLDYVVRAALELAYAATQHDDNVGVMAFA